MLSDEQIYRALCAILLDCGGTVQISKETLYKVMTLQHLGTASGYHIESRTTELGNVIYTVRGPNQELNHES